MKGLVYSFAFAVIASMSAVASVHGGGNPHPNQASGGAVEVKVFAESVHGGGNPHPSGFAVRVTTSAQSIHGGGNPRPNQ
jgi:hypothetical protein